MDFSDAYRMQDVGSLVMEIKLNLGVFPKIGIPQNGRELICAHNLDSSMHIGWGWGGGLGANNVHVHLHIHSSSSKMI